MSLNDTLRRAKFDAPKMQNHKQNIAAAAKEQYMQNLRGGGRNGEEKKMEKRQK